MIKAFELISKSRKLVVLQAGFIYSALTLQDIQSYFDVYGCDITKSVFVECIYALDGKFLKEANK